MIDRTLIEDLVRERLLAALSPNKKSTPSIPSVSDKPVSQSKPLDFVNEQAILAHRGEKVIQLAHNAVVTPSARDMAEQLNIQLIPATSPQASPVIEPHNPNAVVIGADHGGYPLKEEIKKELKNWGYTIVDVGTNSTETVDYPDFAYAVAAAVASGRCKRGIMIDGAGIGSAMAANKVNGVRAAHCTNIYEIKNSREHNDANVLTLGSKVIGSGVAIDMVKMWLETPFAGGRHQRRVEKIMQLEKL